MKKSDILKMRLEQYPYPKTSFKMFHYYLGILNFTIEHDKYCEDGYWIKCKFNNYNPITWVWKLNIFIKETFANSIKRYNSYIGELICPHSFIDVNKDKN